MTAPGHRIGVLSRKRFGTHATERLAHDLRIHRMDDPNLEPAANVFGNGEAGDSAASSAPSELRSVTIDAPSGSPTASSSTTCRTATANVHHLVVEEIMDMG